MRDVAKRLRALGFTVWRCKVNDQYAGLRILSSSGGPVHDTEYVSDRWAVDFLQAIDTTVKSD